MKERQLRLAFFLCIACLVMQAVSRPQPIKTFCGGATMQGGEGEP